MHFLGASVPQHTKHNKVELYWDDFAESSKDVITGYTDFEAVQITEAVKITDSTSKCCDRIDIIYDRSSSERVKISYYVQQYNNRHRLFKKIDKCTKSDCSTTTTLQSYTFSKISEQEHKASYLEGW